MQKYKLETMEDAKKLADKGLVGKVEEIDGSYWFVPLMQNKEGAEKQEDDSSEAAEAQEDQSMDSEEEEEEEEPENQYQANQMIGMGVFGG